MPVIDQATFEELKQMSGEDFINELIDAFLEDGPNMLNNMEIALEAKDVETFRRNAHSLKTNANTFGALELGVQAKELEYMLQNHPTTYTVVSSSETLYSIACKFGDVDPSSIAAANGLSVGAALTAGQQLSIP